MKKKRRLSFLKLFSCAVLFTQCIGGHLLSVEASGFTVRNSPPDKSNPYYYDANYNANAGSSSYAMPNCTTYVLGRVYEITGQRFNISGNAGQYYGNNKSYPCSSNAYEPALGAVVCYSSSGAGHVAVVEEIGEDAGGRYICISESNYSGREYPSRSFNYLKIYLSDLASSTSTGNLKITRLEDNDGYSASQEANWNVSYLNFQGYIYPGNQGGSTPAPDSNVNTRVKATGVTNLGETYAQINAVVSPGARVSEVGFYYGTSPETMQRVVENSTSYVESIWYQLGTKWTSPLEAGTTYYWKIYAIIDGTEYVTDLQSFTTNPSNTDSSANINTRVKATGVTDLGETSAQINATLSPGARVSEVGFYYGTSPEAMQQVVENCTSYVDSIWYQLGTKWTPALEKGTTYYYQIYAVVDGITYKTAVDSFTTKGDVQPPSVTNVYYTDVSKDGYTVYCDVTDNVAVERVSFPTWTDVNDQDDIAGDWYNVTAVKSPIGGTTYSYRVNISEHGNEAGLYHTQIYAYDIYGNVTSGGEVAVVVPRFVTEISLSENSLALEAGETAQITTTINPSDATNKALEYSSSDDSIASVSAEGLVTAKKEGTAVITVKALDGSGVTTTCIVAVAGNTENEGIEMPDNAETPENGWYQANDKQYWYENGIKQGTYYDPKGVMGDGSVRGREIYDPVSDGWYWLDAVYDGAKAINKEVWMPYIYQGEQNWSEDEIRMNAEASGDMAEQVIREIKNGSGKWVRYDANGKMYKGWYTVEGAQADIYPKQAGNTYYYDPKTGLMAKGYVEIEGQTYYFDVVTGVLQ